jgi:RHS repeat-associated protein
VAAAKNAGRPPVCPDDQCANPIKPGSGQKYQNELIFKTPTFNFELAYNSVPMALMPTRPYVFGNGWTHTFGSGVWPVGNKAAALRPDGKFYQFSAPGSGNNFIAESDVSDSLTRLVNGSGEITGWQYRVGADRSLESYNGEGNLTSIVDRNGLTTTLTYSTGSTSPSVAPWPGLLITVTDPYGRTLQFIYDSSGRVTRITDPIGSQYKFYYDESTSVVISGQPLGNNLTSVEFPNTQKRLYHYNEQTNTASTNLPNALTGITDENGNRFSTYQYDSDARAVSTQHAGGVESYSVTYNVDGTRTVTDPHSASRTYDYQTIARVAHTTSISGSDCPSCGSAATTYDANGYVASRTDWNGNLTTYTRADPNGRLDLETSRTEASGSGVARTITTTWHSTFRLPTLITETGRTTAFTYDANGNVLTKTVTDTSTSETRVWTYTYNASGKMLTVDGPRSGSSDTTTYTYYANNDANVGKRGNINTITNAASHVTTFNTYDNNGRPLTITDPNGLVTTLTWNFRGQLASRALGSETTSYAYDYAGQLTRVTLPDSSYLEYTYDNAHRLTQVADNAGNRIVYTLDNMGNRTQEDVKDPGNTLRQTRNRVYSSLNRLYQDIGGATPLTQITTYGYDSQGNLTAVTDPLSHVTTNAYDALNRLISITNPLSGVTGFGLNSKDQLTSVTDPRSNATSYTVNALDDVTQQVSPDTGTTARTFDSAGNVLTSTDAKSQVTTSTYDTLNRITRATFQSGSLIDYGYDAGSYGKGHLTSLTEKNSNGSTQTTTTFTYDQKGRLTTDTRVIGGVSYVTTYGYDSYGRRNSVTYPSGLVLAYSFDSVGRVNQIVATPSGGSAATVLSSATYHPFGGVAGWTFGNSQTYARTYDLDGRVSGFTLAGTAMSLTFDAASRITGQSWFPNSANTVTYGYDNWDRLTSTLTPNTTYGFAYDANSNRTSKTVGVNTWTYAYPGSSNKLSSITKGTTATYTHDANGSVTGDGTNTFSYGVRGRMTGATTLLGAVTYRHNALGQRYLKTLSGTTTVYLYDDAGHLIAETSDGGASYTEYLWLGDTPVAVIKPGSANLYYIHTDHLDTPRFIANQSPVTVWRWDNDDPFGANMANANPGGLGTFTFNLRLPGQYFDQETNNHYNYFRDYSPEIGRYIQSDPIGLRGGTATYTYVKNNPISFADPSGLITECELFALQLIINRYGAGPKIGAGDIITDPTMSGTAGKNRIGGPIVLNTNPKDPQGYSGSVTAKGQSAAAINTGLHENAHQGQNPFVHQFDAWIEAMTGGNISQAQSSAEAQMFKYPQMLQQFNQLVEDCRKCKPFDPDVK